jgi:tetratricopeptide (TPR) repeat protein
LTESEYQQGLQLLHQHRYKDALEHFKIARKLLNNDPDSNLLFNIGLCYWKCNQLPPARRLMQRVLEGDPQDSNARAILQQIEAALTEQETIETIIRAVPTPTVPVVSQKDSVILDANILIKMYHHDPVRFPRTFGKMRRWYSLYTSSSVFHELRPLGEGTNGYNALQSLFEDGIAIVQIEDTAIQDLDQYLCTACLEGLRLKASHMNDERPQAWVNDLSLVCLLQQLEAPIKYIVTNDRGVQTLIKFLYYNLDEQYHLRNLQDFLSTLDMMAQTGQRSEWERRIYEGGK